MLEVGGVAHQRPARAGRAGGRSRAASSRARPRCGADQLGSRPGAPARDRGRKGPRGLRDRPARAPRGPPRVSSADPLTASSSTPSSLGKRLSPRRCSPTSSVRTSCRRQPAPVAQEHRHLAVDPRAPAGPELGPATVDARPSAPTVSRPRCVSPLSSTNTAHRGRRPWPALSRPVNALPEASLGARLERRLGEHAVQRPPPRRDHAVEPTDGREPADGLMAEDAQAVAQPWQRRGARAAARAGRARRAVRATLGNSACVERVSVPIGSRSTTVTRTPARARRSARIDPAQRPPTTTDVRLRDAGHVSSPFVPRGRRRTPTAPRTHRRPGWSAGLERDQVAAQGVPLPERLRSRSRALTSGP